MKSQICFNLKLGLLILVSAGFVQLNAQMLYIAGDFHQHSTFTDGVWSMNHVFEKNNYYGLDWWANSEHGGGFIRDGRKSGADLGITKYWDQDSTIEIMGTVSMSSGHQIMWRWQSLRDFSFPYLNELRNTYSGKLIIQGYEMNVPGHEQSSVAILGSQFNIQKRDVLALSEFEFKFDNSDADSISNDVNGWEKCSLNGHSKTLHAIEWLEANHSNDSWFVPAHPERLKSYAIEHFRDMNNIGPDVCFGFEGMPGHQKASTRGGYSANSFGGTYGGVGYFVAKIGGLWDAMLSEGRNWWFFTSSDFHNVDNDFYPGEYQKTYTLVGQKAGGMEIINGLRSGNSWVVTGDLIDLLNFNLWNGQSSAPMGSTFTIEKGSYVLITIEINDPQGSNHNTYSDYTNPTVDHIDLIAGYVHDKYQNTDSLYFIDSVSTTKVIARFDATGNVTDCDGITSIKWIDRGDGNIFVQYKMMDIQQGMYFRIRGTNLAIHTANEIDCTGNPLPDALMGGNNAAKAFADLWFYSNPIFVTVSSEQRLNSTKENSLSDEITENFEVFPNPFENQLYISNKNQERVNVSIKDMTGKFIMNFNSDNPKIELNLSSLPYGIYFMIIESVSINKTVKLIKPK